MRQSKWLLLSLLIIIADIGSKYAFSETFYLGETLPVMPFFNITLVHNYGMAFGLLSEQGGWQRWFLAAIALLVGIVIIIWIIRLKSNETLLAISLSCILGGALGNLIDRIYLGYVVDFIDVFINTWHWPSFNIADIAISIGTGLLLIDAYLQYKKEKIENNEAKNNNDT